MEWLKRRGSLARTSPGGILFLNIETPAARSIVNRTSATVRTIGFKADADWAISDASLTKEGMTFSVNGNRNLAGSYSICLIGMHQVLNATMAIAVGSELGLGRAEIQRGLSACKPAKMRLQIVPAGAITIFDDTYNANEESMKTALDTLLGYPVEGRRVAILGSMGELGAAAEVALFLGWEICGENGCPAPDSIGRPSGDPCRRGAPKRS